jgi:hypothetical protein
MFGLSHTTHNAHLDGFGQAIGLSVSLPPMCSGGGSLNSGESLKQFVAAKRWSCGRVAQLTGFSRQYVWRVLNGSRSASDEFLDSLRRFGFTG